MGNTDKRHVSSRLKHAGSEEDMTTVDKLVGLLNQEG